MRLPCLLTLPTSQASLWPFHLRFNSLAWWYSLTSFCMTRWIVNDFLGFYWGFPGGTSGKELPANARDIKTLVWPLGQNDPLKDGMATHSSILAWRIPWTEEPGGLLSIGSQIVGHDWRDTDTHTLRKGPAINIAEMNYKYNQLSRSQWRKVNFPHTCRKKKNQTVTG